MVVQLVLKMEQFVCKITGVRIFLVEVNKSGLASQPRALELLRIVAVYHITAISYCRYCGYDWGYALWMYIIS